MGCRVLRGDGFYRALGFITGRGSAPPCAPVHPAIPPLCFERAGLSGRCSSGPTAASRLLLWPADPEQPEESTVTIAMESTHEARRRRGFRKRHAADPSSACVSSTLLLMFQTTDRGRQPLTLRRGPASSSPAPGRVNPSKMLPKFATSPGRALPRCAACRGVRIACFGKPGNASWLPLYANSRHLLCNRPASSGGSLAYIW